MVTIFFILITNLVHINKYCLSTRSAPPSVQAAGPGQSLPSRSPLSSWSERTDTDGPGVGEKNNLVPSVVNQFPIPKALSHAFFIPFPQSRCCYSPLGPRYPEPSQVWGLPQATRQPAAGLGTAAGTDLPDPPWFHPCTGHASPRGIRLPGAFGEPRARSRGSGRPIGLPIGQATGLTITAERVYRVREE